MTTLHTMETPTTDVELEAQRVQRERLVVYVTPYCGYCRRALALLERQQLSACVVDVSGNWALREWLQDVSGQRTVPQVFVGGRSIGGYVELRALELSGALRT